MRINGKQIKAFKPIDWNKKVKPLENYEAAIIGIIGMAIPSVIIQLLINFY